MRRWQEAFKKGSALDSDDPLCERPALPAPQIFSTGSRPGSRSGSQPNGDGGGGSGGTPSRNAGDSGGKGGNGRGGGGGGANAKPAKIRNIKVTWPCSVVWCPVPNLLTSTSPHLNLLC